MTEDAQSRMRGYGPFHEGAEPTAQINAQTAATDPVNGGPHPGTQPVRGGPHPGGDQLGAQPTSGGPISAQPGGDPYAVQPSNGGPYFAGPAGAGPTSGATYPAAAENLDSTGLPVSGTPYDFTPAASYGPFRNTAAPSPDWPVSGTPAPVSGTPAPVSGTSAPVSGTPAPTSGGAPDFTYTGRRIEPSPPPDRNRLIIGLVAGLVTGLLLFGTTGYFVGHSSRPKPDAAPATTPTPTPTTSLGIFEQNQVALNQAHFTAAPALTPLAQGWLPYLSNCARSGEPAGPVRNPGEKTRIRCTLSGMSVIFVEYASIADRDKARVKTLGQNVDARALTPGVGAAMQRPAPSARTTGNYVEYAYKLTEGRAVRTVAGIWWDDTQTPVAAYLLAYWKEGVGESWDPMRDLWSRYA